MCIKKVEAWAFGDKTYDREIDATAAAIESIVGNAGVAKIVFEKIDKLLPLLDRFAELRMYEDAAKAAPTNAGKDPSPEGPAAPPMAPAAVRDLLASTFRNYANDDKAEMKAIIRNAGYADLTDLIDRASDMHVNALLAKLMHNKVDARILDAQGHTAPCRARLTGFEASCNCGVLIRNRTIYKAARQ